MPTNEHQGHDAGQPGDVQGHATHARDSEHPGYEVEDVNVGGLAVFLTGLFGTLLLFFVFCFYMGRAINNGLAKQDGPTNIWHQQGEMGATPTGHAREDLKSDAAIEQQQLAQVAQTFPTPRLETDDGDQDVADLHAREDLLLDNYSTSPDLPSGTVRIPISVAMALIVQRGLPKPATPEVAEPLMAGEQPMVVTAPLTDGFARTAYELDTIESRRQRLDFQKAEQK